MQYETYDFLNGQLTIFYSEAGMTFVSLADDPVADYQAWFGKTQIVPSEEQRYATVMADYLAGRGVDFIPDWQGRGTVLQREVWIALAETDFGETHDVCDVSEANWSSKRCTRCRIGGW